MKHVRVGVIAIVVLALFTTATMFVVDATQAKQFEQIAPLSDQYAIRKIINNQFQTEIYENDITFEIEYRESDLVADVVTLIRVATLDEQTAYLIRRQQIIADAVKGQALESLVGDPENGVPFANWVANRIADLQECETNMGQGQIQDFANLGTNGQNATIHEIERCAELSYRAQWQTIDKLYQLLISQGILE